MDLKTCILQHCRAFTTKIFRLKSRAKSHTNDGPYEFRLEPATIKKAEARIKTIASANCKVKGSPKNKTPIDTAVIGSNAPKIAAIVAPEYFME